MDDLTQIKGIGKVTAERLTASGLETFSALAKASVEQFSAIDKLPGSPADWAQWVAEAQKIAPAPVDLKTATPGEVDEHARLIDAARTRLQHVATAAAAAQESGSAADIELAKRSVDAAQSELDALIGSGAMQYQGAPAEAGPSHQDRADNSDGSTAGEASRPAKPATPPGDGPEGHPSTDNTPESDAAEEGEASQSGAGLPGSEFDFAAAFEPAIIALEAHVMGLIREVSSSAAATFVAEQLEVTNQAIHHLDQKRAELRRLGKVVERTELVWPLGTVRFDGKEQPVGVELKVDPKTFKALTRAGAAADHAPEGL